MWNSSDSHKSYTWMSLPRDAFLLYIFSRILLSFTIRACIKTYGFLVVVVVVVVISYPPTSATHRADRDDRVLRTTNNECKFAQWFNAMRLCRTYFNMDRWLMANIGIGLAATISISNRPPKFRFLFYFWVKRDIRTLRSMSSRLWIFSANTDRFRASPFYTLCACVSCVLAIYWPLIL